VTGTITEINPELNNKPELVNSDPYGEGWMIKVKIDNPADVDALLTSEAYSTLVGN
jgi:glycine cleavage system H protein